MKIASSVLLSLGTTLLLLASAQEQKQANAEPAPRGTVIVKQLPASVEGLERLREWLFRL
jgi:hypothetical protein